MQFNVHQDLDPIPVDAAGELELPAELKSLASLLAGEAQSLAAAYPADREANHADLKIPRSARKRTLLITAAPLAACAGAIALAVLFLLPAGQPATPVAETVLPTSDRIRGDGEQRIGRAEGVAAITPQETIGPEDNEVRPVSASFLLNLSGPELEGVLDVWEADGEQAPPLSI